MGLVTKQWLCGHVNSSLTLNQKDYLDWVLWHGCHRLTSLSTGLSGTIWEGLKSMALFGKCVTGERLEVSGLRFVDGDVSSQWLLQHHACLPAACSAPRW